jgi:hypothetical protein
MLSAPATAGAVGAVSAPTPAWSNQTPPPPPPLQTAPGPFCHRVLLTLETKNIPYDAVYIDFEDKPKW